jgi:Glycosyl transferase family 2
MVGGVPPSPLEPKRTPQGQWDNECRDPSRGVVDAGSTVRSLASDGTSSTVPISVALCTRNGSRYLEAQLASIFAQSRRPSQLVISDDASKDDSVELARRLCAEDTVRHPDEPIDVTILRNDPPLGVTLNFQNAVDACTGEIIVLCDQDDVWHPDRLALGVAALEASSADLVFANATLVDADGSPLGLTLFDALEISQSDLSAIRAGEAFGVLIRRNIATGATVLFRRSLCESAVPFPGTWLHDEWLAAIAAAIGRVGVVDDELIDYRQHGSNEVGVRKATLARKVAKVFEARGERNAGLTARADSLVERLERLGPAVHAGALDAARAKARFEAQRVRLPARRALRLRGILAARAAGSYAAYASQGNRDVLRDLLQSHRATD